MHISDLVALGDDSSELWNQFGPLGTDERKIQLKRYRVQDRRQHVKTLLILCVISVSVRVVGRAVCPTNPGSRHVR